MQWENQCAVKSSSDHTMNDGVLLYSLDWMYFSQSTSKVTLKKNDRGNPSDQNKAYIFYFTTVIMSQSACGNTTLRFFYQAR